MVAVGVAQLSTSVTTTKGVVAGAGPPEPVSVRLAVVTQIPKPAVTLNTPACELVAVLPKPVWFRRGPTKR